LQQREKSHGIQEGASGRRNEEQLRQNLGAVGWSLTKEQVERLDNVSSVSAPYPYFPYRRQEGFARLHPPLA
jgi:diketogulonate reductase-like aldo/keto reductase